MKQKSIYFYVAVLGVFFGICSPMLFTQGMFMDGTTYAAIAKNMALGDGTFWKPHCSDTYITVFYGHPPLAIWIESLFFRIAGTSILVERFYSVSCILFIGFLMVKIWKEFTNEIITAWIPLLLLISFPVITWTATNNMLENTMSIFICLSVWLYLIRLRKKKYYFTLLAGLVLCLGVLSKGIVAFFPWTFPFWIWLFSKKIPFKQVVGDTLSLVICTLLPLFLCYILSKDAKLFFDAYLYEQLFSSVTGLRDIAESRFLILKTLWQQVIPCLILVTGLFLVLIAKKKTDLLTIQIRNSLILFSLSFSGILPVMLSLQQRGFYIIPAYPFLAIAFALLFQPFIKQLMEKINGSSRGFLLFKIISCAVFIAVIVFAFSQKGKMGRDKKELSIVFECSKYIPPNTTISIDKETFSNWSLHAYFARYKSISLDDGDSMHSYYLHNPQSPLPPLNEDYVHLTDIEGFGFYMRKE